jgi:hypothetical protein
MSKYLEVLLAVVFFSTVAVGTPGIASAGGPPDPLYCVRLETPVPAAERSWQRMTCDEEATSRGNYKTGIFRPANSNDDLGGMIGCVVQCPMECAPAYICLGAPGR